MEATERQLHLGRFPVTSGLLALLVGVFLVEVLRGGSTNTLNLLRLGANYPPLVFDGQWFRLLTAALLHIGPLHMVMYGWALWQLGRLSEITFGGPVTLALFVFTGITGSLLTLVDTKVSAGASGALFGLEGALVAFFLRHRERLTPSGKHLLKQLLIWSGFMLVYSFAVPGIDWLGHIGGLLGGLAVGWALQPWRGGPAGPLAKVAGGIAALAIVAALAGAMAAERFVPVRSTERGLALEAPASWRVDSREAGLVVRDPLGPFGSAAFVSVGVETAPDRDAALRLALEDEEGLPAGFDLGPQSREIEGGWLRRTFVWRMDRGELAGFAQARCEDTRCVVAFAVSDGELYRDYFPMLDRIALSARAL